MARLAILCGLPRRGKTTWAKSLERDGWVHICPDDIRLALHGQPFVKEAESTVWRSRGPGRVLFSRVITWW